MTEGFVQTLFGWIDSPVGMVLRNLIYRIMIKYEGRVFIWPRVSLQHCYGLTIGKNCAFNTGVVIDARGGITIGSNTLVRPNAVLVSSSHNYSVTPINSAPHIIQPLHIGEDVWIGANAVVLGGITVAVGSIIGAGAVVTQDTVSNGIYAGIPAKLIGFRRNEQQELNG